MSEEIAGCCICGMPHSACPLIRLSFVEDGRGRIIGSQADPFQLLSIAVAKVPAANDCLVCEDCIRGIKRISFGDLEAGRYVEPPRPVLPNDNLPF